MARSVLRSHVEEESPMLQWALTFFVLAIAKLLLLRMKRRLGS